MDYSEWIALTIVALAVLFYGASFFKKSKGSCCEKTGCPVPPKTAPRPSRRNTPYKN